MVIMGECDSRYSTHIDGQWTQVVPLEESVRSIKAHIESVERRNKYLEEENKKLKDEAYMSNELAEMKAQLEKARKDLYRGFGISKEEEESIKVWKEKHDVEAHGLNTLDKKLRAGGAIGGRYTYHFVPTSIGTIGTVKCSCGASFDFSEL